MASVTNVLNRYERTPSSSSDSDSEIDDQGYDVKHRDPFYDSKIPGNIPIHHHISVERFGRSAMSTDFDEDEQVDPVQPLRERVSTEAAEEPGCLSRIWTAFCNAITSALNWLRENIFTCFKKTEFRPSIKVTGNMKDNAAKKFSHLLRIDLTRTETGDYEEMLNQAVELAKQDKEPAEPDWPKNLEAWDDYNMLPSKLTPKAHIEAFLNREDVQKMKSVILHGAHTTENLMFWFDPKGSSDFYYFNSKNFTIYRFNNLDALQERVLADLNLTAEQLAESIYLYDASILRYIDA